MTSLSSIWDTFLKRRVVAAHPAIGLVLHPDFSVRFRPLAAILVSLLYIDLVSILDEACLAQLTPAEQKKYHKLNDRIDILDKRGIVLAPAKLHAIRRHRNSIAHQMGRAKRKDLDDAVKTIQQQLRAWR